jgi:hypothetical protein
VIDPETGRPDPAQARLLAERDRWGRPAYQGATMRLQLARFHGDGLARVGGTAGDGCLYFDVPDVIPEDVARELEMDVHEAARAALVEGLSDFARRVLPVAVALQELRL